MLSAAQVKTAKPGRYGDGRGSFGLSLLVKEVTNGRMSRTWAQRLRFDGEPFNLGLGIYPVVGLAKARERALANARLVSDGVDPRIKGTTNTIPTFAKAVEPTITVLRADWKPGGGTEYQMRKLLGEYALPSFGRVRIDRITPAQVLDVVSPVALASPSTGRKLKGFLSQVFQAVHRAPGYRTDNPADRNINGALPKLADQGNTTRRYRGPTFPAQSRPSGNRTHGRQESLPWSF